MDAGFTIDKDTPRRSKESIKELLSSKSVSITGRGLVSISILYLASLGVSGAAARPRSGPPGVSVCCRRSPPC